MMTAKQEPEWRQYERQIYDRLRERTTDGTQIEAGKHLPGRYSGIERQIDVLLRGGIKGVVDNLVIVVDCKCWKNNIDVTDIERLLGLVEDVAADRGLLITTTGATRAAYRRAGHSIQIEVLPFDDLAKWTELLPTVALTTGASHGTVSYFDGEAMVTEYVEREYAERLLSRLSERAPKRKRRRGARRRRGRSRRRHRL